MVVTLSFSTPSRTSLQDITDPVADTVRKSGVREGLCTVFVPHTTAAVTINENSDPDVKRDLVTTLNRLVPREGDYRHSEGNSDAHVKASLVGHTVTVPVSDGRLLLGTWQGILLCEFDGPRRRTVIVSIT